MSKSNSNPDCVWTTVLWFCMFLFFLWFRKDQWKKSNQRKFSWEEPHLIRLQNSFSTDLTAQPAVWLVSEGSFSFLLIVFWTMWYWLTFLLNASHLFHIFFEAWMSLGFFYSTAGFIVTTVHILSVLKSNSVSHRNNFLNVANLINNSCYSWLIFALTQTNKNTYSTCPASIFVLASTKQICAAAAAAAAMFQFYCGLGRKIGNISLFLGLADHKHRNYAANGRPYAFYG